MSDVATAATMNALNVERLQLRASVEALQALLEERRAYAERLLAENVRLTNEAAFMRGFINSEDVRSDYRNVTEMRAALDAARAELEQYRMRLAGALIASEGGDGQPSDALEYLRTCPTITSVAKLRKALTRERSRADVLEREVRDTRAWHDTDARSTGQMMELSSNWDKSRAETDSTNALDAAKFEGQP